MLTTRATPASTPTSPSLRIARYTAPAQASGVQFPRTASMSVASRGTRQSDSTARPCSRVVSMDPMISGCIGSRGLQHRVTQRRRCRVLRSTVSSSCASGDASGVPPAGGPHWRSLAPVRAEVVGLGLIEGGRATLGEELHPGTGRLGEDLVGDGRFTPPANTSTEDQSTRICRWTFPWTACSGARWIAEEVGAEGDVPRLRAVDVDLSASRRRSRPPSPCRCRFGPSTRRAWRCPRRRSASMSSALPSPAPIARLRPVGDGDATGRCVPGPTAQRAQLAHRLLHSSTFPSIVCSAISRGTLIALRHGSVGMLPP